MWQWSPAVSNCTNEWSASLAPMCPGAISEKNANINHWISWFAYFSSFVTAIKLLSCIPKNRRAPPLKLHFDKALLSVVEGHELIDFAHGSISSRQLLDALSYRLHPCSRLQTKSIDCSSVLRPPLRWSLSKDLICPSLELIPKIINRANQRRAGV